MSDIVEEKGPSYRWWILVMTSLVNIIVIGLAWMCMPVLFSEISQKTGWSIEKLFASWGIIPLAIVFLNIPAGLIGDKYGIRKVVGIGIIIMSIAGALRGLSDSYLEFMIWTFVFGCTFPFAAVLLPKALGVYFTSKELGMANGIVLGAYGAGAAFSLMFSGTIISSAVGGWQNVVYLYGVLSLIIGIVWLMTVKDRPVEEPSTEGAKVSTAGILLGLLKNREVLVLCLIYFLTTGAWLGISGAYPSLAVNGRGLEPQVAHFVISIALVAFVIGCFIIPTVSDKIGLRRPIYCIGIFLSGLCMFITCVSKPPMIWVWVSIWGLAGAGIPLIFSMPMEMPQVGPAIGGTAIGLIMAVGNLGGFLFPIATAAISSRMDPGTALIWIGVLCGFIGYVLTGALIWMIKETGPKARGTITNQED